jgi:flavorubredoxin
METTVQEIADGIYRFSTHVPEIVPPAGFTFNQFLVKGDEPFLFHCGHRQMFTLISAALARVMPIDQLRWISFGHVEADESGAMNRWLAAAPRAEIAFGRTGCMVSVNDLADRPPRALADGEVVDLGGKRLRYLSTPHVPHNWESGLFYEEETGTLLCGDLFTHLGNGPAITANDILGPAVAAEEVFHASALCPDTGTILHRLAGLRPKTLALMHGSSFNGNCAAALDALAVYYTDLNKAV